MFGATPAWFTVSAAGFLAAAVSFLFQFLKPLLEAVPLLKPGSTAHDTTLRAVVFLLNLGGVVALAATASAFDLRAWLTYAALAGAQTVGGHLLYAASTSGKVDAPVFGDSTPIFGDSTPSASTSTSTSTSTSSIPASAPAPDPVVVGASADPAAAAAAAGAADPALVAASAS